MRPLNADAVISADAAALILTSTSLLGAPAASAMTQAVLYAVGFTSVGVTQGSFAAWWQSTMPHVVKGSGFAMLQSIAMGGVGAKTFTVGALAGCHVGGGAVHWKLLAKACRAIDLEVSKCSVVGKTIQANTTAVQTALPYLDGAIEAARRAAARFARGVTLVRARL